MGREYLITENDENNALDDIFDLDNEDDNRVTDENRTEVLSSQDPMSNPDELADDAYDKRRKNNIEEDIKVAEAIINGVAEYTEFKVFKEKKKSKRKQ